MELSIKWFSLIMQYKLHIHGCLILYLSSDCEKCKHLCKINVCTGRVVEYMNTFHYFIGFGWAKMGSSYEE